MSHHNLSYQPLQTYQSHRNGKKRFTIVLLIIIIIVTASVMLYPHLKKKKTVTKLNNEQKESQLIRKDKEINKVVAKIEVIKDKTTSEIGSDVDILIKSENKKVITKLQPKKEIKIKPKKDVSPVEIKDIKKTSNPAEVKEILDMPSLDKELMALNIADVNEEQKKRDKYVKGKKVLLSKAQRAYDNKDYFATHYLLQNIVNKQNFYATDKINAPAKKTAKDSVDSTIIADSKANDATELTLNEEKKKQAENFNDSKKIPFELWLKMARLYSNANAKTFFTGKSFAPFNKTMYQVGRGDALQKIAKKFNTTIIAIQRQNGMDKFNYNIRVGENINVYNGSLHIIINKSKFLLMLYDKNNLFAVYNIALGKNNKTPIGNFKTVSKVIEPDWYSDNGKIAFGDKRNVLGTRWMEMKSTDQKNRSLKGYGIHGTWERNSINKMRSNGCVRMLNENIEELFDIIPLNTPIKIIE